MYLKNILTLLFLLFVQCCAAADGLRGVEHDTVSEGSGAASGSGSGSGSGCEDCDCGPLFIVGMLIGALIASCCASKR